MGPSSIDKLRRQCIANKMGIARSIVLTAGQKGIRNSRPKTQEEMIDLVMRMTFIDKVTIKALLLHNNQTPKATFQSCLIKTTDYTRKVPYEDLRKITYTLYVKNQTVPTKEKILNHFKNEHYTIADLNEDFKANKFMLKKLVNSKKALIVEDPEQILKRMVYLSKMRCFRMLGRPFVYITYKENFSLAVTTETILMYAFHKKANHVLKFIQNLIPCMVPSAVVVLDSRVPFELKKTPNQYSTKQSMKEWLTTNEIPFEDDAHTAELYALIQKFKRKIPEKCDVSKYLEDRGFDVLRVPTELPHLSYFEPIFRQIKEMKFKREEISIQATIKKYGTNELTSLEELLEKEEIRIYCEDLEIERVVDMIGVASSRKAFLPRDFKSCGLYDTDSVPRYIILD